MWKMETKPIMLMILDGFGINEKSDGNAVKQANMPNFNKLLKIFCNNIIFIYKNFITEF